MLSLLHIARGSPDVGAFQVVSFAVEIVNSHDHRTAICINFEGTSFRDNCKGSKRKMYRFCCTSYKDRPHLEHSRSLS